MACRHRRRSRAVAVGASRGDLGGRRRSGGRVGALRRRAGGRSARRARRRHLCRGAARRRRRADGGAAHGRRLPGRALHQPHRRGAGGARAGGRHHGLPAQAAASRGAGARARSRHRALRRDSPAQTDARGPQGDRARQGHADGALRPHRGRGLQAAAAGGDGQPQADGRGRARVARLGVRHPVIPHRTTASTIRASGAPPTSPEPSRGDAMSTYSRRDFLKTGLAAAGAGVAVAHGFPSIIGAQGKDPVKIGVLHSLSGTMAISEVSLRDVVLMAVDEINAKGGVMGRPIQPVVVDPASNWDLFAEKAKQLLLQDKVAVVFGCWTSVSRKSVLPVFENNNGLLFYPVQYEGEECSKNVFYTGATPNQQLIPGAEYLMSKEGGAYKKFYLLGTDYVFPRTANKILRAFLVAKGVPADNIAEEYTPFSHQDYQTIVGKIKRFSSGGNACVLSTINGDSNVPFYKEFANQGLRSENAPIMAYSVAEDELRGMDTSALVGHLAAWNYFQSIENANNKKFVNAFKEYAQKKGLPGGAKRVTDDPMEAAYFGVYVWKQAAEKAKSLEVDTVRKAVYGQEFLAPGGKIKMDEANQHAYKPVLIGEILKDGQFKVVSRSKGLVKAEPWSQYTSPDKGCDWIKHQGTYQKKA